MATTALGHTGALSRFTVAAVAAALVATGTDAVAADAPGNASKAREAASRLAESRPAAQAPAARSASTASAPTVEHRYLYGISGATLYEYRPDGRGGYGPRAFWDRDWDYYRNAAQVNNDGDANADDAWLWSVYGELFYISSEAPYVYIGGGWNIYNKVISPGSLGGAASADLIARDGSGKLWLYLGHSDGKLTGRTLIGTGWNIYSHISGYGDLTGDGRADIVTTDKSGVLWLHPGSGDYKKPFNARIKIGGGWNTFTYLAGVADLDLDGKNDIIARDKAGALYRYSGTGSARAPFKPKVKIGTGGWNTYRVLF
ncbi:VCBS repeat-containing protein [Streptomyces sp. NPDC006798]|uniref:FG-GAP repeat domain-containing protein n=1 Tax=Streptomyces sp. NPDC006798 TaxID=3155462 RepID=UPI0034087CF8